MLRKCAYVGVKWFIIKIDSISSFFASAIPRGTIGKCWRAGISSACKYGNVLVLQMCLLYCGQRV